MSSEDIERRRRLESAVEDDDWSSVIDGQTKLTEDPKVEEEAPTATVIRFVLACGDFQLAKSSTIVLAFPSVARFVRVFSVDCLIRRLLIRMYVQLMAALFVLGA